MQEDQKSCENQTDTNGRSAFDKRTFEFFFILRCAFAIIDGTSGSEGIQHRTEIKQYSAQSKEGPKRMYFAKLKQSYGRDEVNYRFQILAVTNCTRTRNNSAQDS